MEHELDYLKPTFYQDLNALMVASSNVRIQSWARAQRETLVLDLIKQHNYRVEVYTILNHAKLLPNIRIAPAAV